MKIPGEDVRGNRCSPRGYFFQLVVLVALQMLQAFLPGNPQHLPSVPLSLIHI